jgi:hypothetical protein
VFYSCNHLPYRSKEPYVSMFADPAYQGQKPQRRGLRHRPFIGGTDLESKWKALPRRKSPRSARSTTAAPGVRRLRRPHSKALERNGLADNTIVIITSDHGDDLYEPGVTLGHGLTFNGGGQANHVPMIVHVPGGCRASSRKPCGSSM